MKRFVVAFALLIAMPVMAAQEKWYEAYMRGVKAVDAKNYHVAVEALQKAIAEMPNESTAAKVRTDTMVYLPHFWLGIAKFHVGDIDAALREWKISEEQGAISRTDHYATMKGWVAQAQAAKLRAAKSNAAESKKNADAALSRALSGQMEALSAGGDRSETYRNAQRKLQEALSTFNGAGNDVRAYQRAAETASQARELFDAAAEESKKKRAAELARPKPQPVKPQPVPVPVPVPQPVIVAPPPIPVESETLVATRVALQQYRRHLIDAKAGSKEKDLHRFVDAALKTAEGWESEVEKKPADEALQKIATEIAKHEAALTARMAVVNAPAPVVAAIVPPPVAAPAVDNTREQLQTAYRAFAMGDLAHSEQLLTALLRGTKSGEAYLLRGCARYTRAMLSREPESLLASATSDFKTALRLNRSLRLDDDAFSPKLVAFFEQVRNGR